MASNFFSIVVPALNEEKYLSLCLDSLKNQDYKGKYEIIVVDNGSTDGTSRVARELGAKVIICEKKGVVYARQTGAEASSGDIIIQADADTFYPVNWLSRIDRDFILHPKAAGLAGTYVYLDQPLWANIEYFLRYLVNILSIIFIGSASLISGANFAFRREAFEKAHGYSVRSLYPDQWGIAHRLSKYGKIYYNRSLYVKTSVRRLNKPFIRVFLDVGVNTIRVFKHFLNFLKLESNQSKERRYRRV
jgi:glycosyltransferase involved in cell wall biosynthesis